ncbi:MAG TPA: 23S rRNA (adenine(2503)-C(2))-methyltransferase RlmN [Oscillospiraceae bacterium]|nr:23S rRNA (adenine(2503)-C(2))-methyltransferase RlmN [Oscillospiraceae bacterium]
MNLKDIKSMTLSEIKEDFAADGLPAFRALQVFKWLHRGVTDFEEMSDQSKAFRQQLAQKYYISVATIEKKLVSHYDDTIKYLFRLNDGEYVECVLMSYHHGYSVCISTQVGCKMNCSFCATGKSGFSRNLSASEMLAQIQAAQADTGERISNVVLMGMGEPLDNYDNVLRFLELVSSDDGLNIGMRHISLSTCGIVDKIYDLAEKKLQLTLSISLHAPNDSIRSLTMPVNKKWGIDELLKACRYYSDLTNKRISFEYAMISGVNDSDECAYELANRLKGILSHVNLIPVNDVTGANYKKSSGERLQKFSQILGNKGITATVRRTLGSDINASCGQLRRRYKEEVANVERI